MSSNSDPRPCADPHPANAVVCEQRASRALRWRRMRRILTFLANTFAPALVLLTPFAAFLAYHRYEVWRAEVLLCVSYLLLAGLAISAVILLRRQLLRPAVFGLLLFLFADFHARLSESRWIAVFLDWEYAYEYGPIAVIAGGTVLLLGAMSLTWALREYLGIVFATVFGTMLISLSILPTDRIAVGEVERTEAEPRNDLAPILHLVLDAQIGLAGLPPDIPESQALRKELAGFYQRYGFTVFSRAYSPYVSTSQSLSNLLNGETALSVNEYIIESTDSSPLTSRKLTDNAWFHHLSDLGYAIRVYQTDYFDFCDLQSARIDFCYVVPSNSIYSLKDARVPTEAKAQAILKAYFSGALLPGILAKLLSSKSETSEVLSAPIEWLSGSPRLGAISAANLMERIAEAPATARRGTATFAHVLIPHGAYILDSDCRPRPDIDEWLGPWAANPPADTNSPASRRARYLLYFDQVRCTHKRVAAILDRLADADALADATVIVHGDHGSRIALRVPEHEAVRQYSERDLIDTHSALFAVRSPDLSPGQNRRMETIQKLFAEVALRRPPEAESSGVYLSSSPLGQKDQTYVEVPMPEF